MEAEKRKLIKFSNYSLCVTLPKWVIRELKWKKGDLVNMEVDTENGKIIVSGDKKSSPMKSESKKIAGKTVEKKEPDSLRW
jgi:antitoxin component of MazEF toxin-antitoxin module